MELSLKALCFILGYFTLCSFHFSSASRGLENERCGSNGFYCPTNGKCFDRTPRCTSASVCLDSRGKEAKCYESNGKYKYFKKESPLPSSSSSRKKRNVVSWLNHWFVEYRGFVYEFGAAGFQELDINDPNYKYGPRRQQLQERTNTKIH